ncbi:MAG: bifunctional UDP-N-acetylmuramoyl-tripeptide:D-alanyl-D-alanine ligase/alanine racemase [Bacteroidales bacterium]|nr:bifunctional UDP-N-acetylmuramoyl-tripeptide:D-alanyl-D-alanine ligase/alanine racemase [Bacteroidales bacterium]
MISAYTISGIANIINGDLIQSNDPNFIIRELAFDSRKIQHESNILFFALVSSRNDGHKYIGDLYTKNIQNYIVNRSFKDVDKFPEANFIQVDDTLKALQTLAKHHRKQFRIPVIGITGSNGKTAVKEWLYQLLCDNYTITYSPNSFNSQIGVPLSIWNLHSNSQLGIFEAGISKPDEMNILKEIVEPTIGILTNVGTAHDEHFMDIKQKIGEKLNLFRNVETLIYCTDNGLITEVLMRTELTKKIKLFTWSRKKDTADLYVKNIDKQNNSTEITGVYNQQNIKIKIPFIDDAAIENTIQCWACMLLLGFSNDIIADRINRLTPISMRLEMKQGINRCMIINDTYNSDINSLQIALDLMINQKQFQKRTVILSDILQSRSSEYELYNEIADLLKTKEIQKIIGIGEAISRQANSFTIEKEFYKTTNDFFSDFNLSKVENEIILIKGARSFNFERISNYLELKSHETVLDVDLNALVNNLNYYRSLLHTDTKIMAMVKAFGYGIGDIDIANELQYHKIDYLTVAYADEGIELKNKNIHTPIMVMNPEERSIESILKYQLQPEVYSFRILHLIIQAMEHNPQIPHINVHLKIDTGMHRLGFEKQNLGELLLLLSQNPKIIIESIFSHLAAADDPKEDIFTRQQANLFSECYDIISNHIGYKPIKHITNSIGTIRFPEYQFDMVRLGIGLFGINAFANPTKLENVASLRTIISQIKYIKKGDTVGYNREYTAVQNMTLATIPIGYADGFPRSLGKGNGVVLINNQLAKIIGNVCMDMSMVDITHIQAKEGDTVLIFGKEISIQQVAKTSKRTEYEVLTSISQRVKRVFIQS